MLGIIFFIFFIVSFLELSIALYRKMKRTPHPTHESVVNLEDEIKALTEKEQEIKRESNQKEATATRTMNLYEITKEMGEFLEEGKIFDHFKAGLKKFISYEECNYLNTIEEQQDVSGFEIIPLVSRNKEYGYLAVKGIDEKKNTIS